MSNHVPDELSEREHEILRLVATGASNKEIALQLFISPNTVKVHLRNIFAKIGAASRTEAAMYAVRNRLVSESGGLPSIEVPFSPGVDQIPISQTEPDPVSMVASFEPEPKIPTFLGMSKRRAAFFGFAFLSIFAALALILLPRLLQPQEEAVSSSFISDSSERWREISAMSEARQFPAAVAYEGSIYVIGGENQSGATGSVEQYNPNSDLWLSMAEKPLPVSEIQAVVLEDKIYVPGGKSADQSISDQMELYDPQLNTWERGSDLPIPVSAYALVAFEGKILLFGGWDGQRYLAEVYEYDPGQDEWRYLTKMESPRAFAGSVVIGNQIYIAGGTADQEAYSDILVYRPNQGEAGEWDESLQMPSDRYASGVATLADSIYFIGGLTNQGETPSPWQYNPQLKGWYTFEPPELARWSSMAAVPLQNLIYAFGGKVNEKPSATVLTFQALYTLAIPIVR